MNYSTLFKKIGDKFIRLSMLALLPAFFAAFSADATAVFGQPKLGDSVYKNNKSADDSNKSKSSKKKAKPAVAKNNGGTAKRNVSNAGRKSSPKNFLNVTFLSREEGVEVYLDDKNIGKTDESLQLSKKLIPGEYLLTARHERRVLIPTRRITISAEQTTVKLFEEVVPPPTPVIEEPVETQEKPEAENGAENSEKVKKVLENYGNPATTDAVTTEDWEMVFKTAQGGQLQGYTAVQIEAQRWFASGQIELAKGDITSAFTAFYKAQEFMPTSALPFFALGNTYLLDKKYADALKLYQKALQIDPKLAMGYKKLGDTQRLLGKEKEAIAAYKNALQFGYNTLETRLWLGTLMLETKQIEEAIKELEAVAKEMPKAEVFISIGNGYEKLKRDVSAIEAYQKAIDADPNSALAYYKLASVYDSQREYTKAKEAFQKALDLDPEGKIVNKAETQKKLREVESKINNK
jgi:tetratricopeptide (TPR) repeat protein